MLVALVVAAVVGQQQITHNMALARVRTKNASLSLLGKHALVVGGTNGIGAGIAIRLAQANVSVTIVGRSAERGAEIVKQMKAAAGESDASYDFVACNVMDLQEVVKCTESIKQQHSVLDYLVLTAGIATVQGRTETKQGLDEKMAMHYYSRVLFVNRLLPRLKESTDSRVLFVLSGGVHSSYSHYKDDPELKEHYTLKNAADAAGFYTDIAVDSLSRENPDVTFIHASPGFVSTAWGTEMPTLLRYAIRYITVVVLLAIYSFGVTCGEMPTRFFSLSLSLSLSSIDACKCWESLRRIVLSSCVRAFSVPI